MTRYNIEDLKELALRGEEGLYTSTDNENCLVLVTFFRNYVKLETYQNNGWVREDIYTYQDSYWIHEEIYEGKWKEMNILDKDSLVKLNKGELINHILKQVKYIDSNRGYSSDVKKSELITYSQELLIEIALTNNTYIKDFQEA